MKKLIMYLYSIIMSLFVTTKQPLLQEKPNLPLRLNIQHFAGDGGEGAEGGGEGGDGEGAKDEPFATFNTKEELNKRLGRAEKAGQKNLAKQLGFDSVEAMQEALKQKEDKSGKDEKKKDDSVDVDKVIEEKLKEVNAQAFKRLLNAEVKLVANELGFADHSDALALADLSEVTENEKGDLEGVKEALEKLAKEKPHLIKQSGSGNFGSDISRKPKDDKAHLENIAKLAQSRGVQTTTVNDPWKR
ncbi:scaffolding protein [Sporosarcina saromensis]|uniref:Scaffolding protein n=1 Tax=Sporosarcina saromensis TaxID=359365 RepID=A0ABU4GA43_9BACL|nr:scaffolding protein [Sporosarcina saromensis]MDW0113771.1 scaffolding protein [Sporosarcina saromensis]